MTYKEEIEITYHFEPNSINGKMRIYIDLYNNKDIDGIIDTVKEKVIPRMEKKFLNKDLPKNMLCLIPIEFKEIVQDMIYYGALPKHKFSIWYNGRKV